MLTHSRTIAAVTTIRHARSTAIIGLRHGSHEGSWTCRCGGMCTHKGSAGKCRKVGNLMEMHLVRWIRPRIKRSWSTTLKQECLYESLEKVKTLVKADSIRTTMKSLFNIITWNLVQGSIALGALYSKEAFLGHQWLGRNENCSSWPINAYEIHPLRNIYEVINYNIGRKSRFWATKKKTESQPQASRPTVRGWVLIRFYLSMWRDKLPATLGNVVPIGLIHCSENVSGEEHLGQLLDVAWLSRFQWLGATFTALYGNRHEGELLGIVGLAEALKSIWA